jgi:DNA-binding CsgD family transcriptional regulator
LALLRWSGCTANAAEFYSLFGDDVLGRSALISGLNPFLNGRKPGPEAGPIVSLLSIMHCDTAAHLTARILLDAPSLAAGFAHLFENWDGTGVPTGISGDAISPLAQCLSVASDLEVWSRVHGLNKGMQMLEATANSRHDPHCVTLLQKHAATWLNDIDNSNPWHEAANLAELHDDDDAHIDEAACLLADYADLKCPSIGRVSRRAAELLQAAGAAPETRRAAHLHGLGWVSVSNNGLSAYLANGNIVDERCRLVPHWTERCLSRTKTFRSDAARAYERADGTGFPRGLSLSDVSQEDSLLQAAVFAARKVELSDDETLLALRSAVRNRYLTDGAVEAICAGMGATTPRRVADDRLSTREREILNWVSRGSSNKEIARQLEISPSTVGSHVENIYRKLDVSNRATATLKGLELGLLN